MMPMTKKPVILQRLNDSLIIPEKGLDLNFVSWKSSQEFGIILVSAPRVDLFNITINDR